MALAMIDIGHTMKVGLFAGIPPRQLDTLLGGARRVLFKAGDEILAQGQVNGALYVVEDGVLHARRAGGRRSVFLARLERGSFFGEMSLFDAAPTSASIRAVSDGSLIRVTRDCLEAFIDRYPRAGAELLQRILRGLARRLRLADDRVTNALLFGAPGAVRGKESR